VVDRAISGVPGENADDLICRPPEFVHTTAETSDDLFLELNRKILLV